MRRPPHISVARLRGETSISPDQSLIRPETPTHIKKNPPPSSRGRAGQSDRKMYCRRPRHRLMEFYISLPDFWPFSPNYPSDLCPLSPNSPSTFLPPKLIYFLDYNCTIQASREKVPFLSYISSKLPFLICYILYLLILIKSCDMSQ